MNRKKMETEDIRPLPRCITERMSRLLRSGLYSDVTFVVGEGSSRKIFKAHRLILSAASDVFGAMFYGSIAEATTTIALPDLDPKGFDVMLRYVYEDEVEFDSADHAVEALRVAHKYLLEHLKELCCNYLHNYSKPDTVCQIYEIACLYDMYFLQMKALQEVVTNTEVVIGCKSFLSAHQSTVELLLRQGELAVSSETKLFDALIDWGNAQVKKDGLEPTPTNIRPVIDPLLPFIRFLTMTVQEFVDGPAKSGVLTDEEMLPLMMNIVSAGTRPLPSWCSDKPQRSRPSSKEFTCTVCCLNYLNQEAPRNGARYVECKLSVKKKNVFILGVGFALKQDYFHHKYPISDFRFCVSTTNTKKVFTARNDIQGTLTFWNLSQGCRSLCALVTGEIDAYGNCRAMFPTPQLVCQGGSCMIRIDFGEIQSIGRCTGEYSKEVTSEFGVEFLIESNEVHVTDRSHVHEIVFWCFD